MIPRIGALIGLFSAVTATFAQPQPDIIDSLARGWSGGRSTSSCSPEPSKKGEATSSICEWLLPQSQRVQGAVTTTRYRSDSAMVVWQRDLSSASDMRRVVDSLGIAFNLRGMTMRLCRPGSAPAGAVDGRIWEDRRVLVHISATTPPSAGPAKLLVIGVDHPGAYPDVVCPKRRDAPGR